MNIKIDIINPDVHIVGEIKKRITRIGGDSAVGKTYLYNSLSSAEKGFTNQFKEVTLGNDNVKVIRISGTDNFLDPLYNLDAKFNAENSLIIVDEADKILCVRKDLRKTVVSNKSSHYILISRKYYPEIPLPLFNNAVLRFDSDKLKILYYEDLINEAV